MTMRQSAGGAGDIDEPECSPQEERVEDPADRPEPYVKGPTGAATLASESRGDPGAEGDRGGEGGAGAGVVAGTAMAGPIGGVVGGLAGGAIGTASIDADDEQNPDRTRTDETDVADRRADAGSYTPFDDRR